MPTTAEIRSGLALIAREATAWRHAWHVLLLAAAVALLAGWRPSHRVAGVLLSLPLFSVSAFALLYRSPFNAVVVGLLALVLPIV